MRLSPTLSSYLGFLRLTAALAGHLAIITGDDELEAGLTANEKVYASSWKKAEPFPGFVRELVRTCAARGWLRLGVAWLDQEPIAAQIWIVAHGRAETFKLAHDESHRQLSAGTLLTAALMQRALDQDHAHEVDYLIGDDAYKRTWMTQRHDRWGIVAYDPLRPSGLFSLIRQLVGTALRLVLGTRISNVLAGEPNGQQRASALVAARDWRG